jgi:predicted nucleic acid-binding protein
MNGNKKILLDSNVIVFASKGQIDTNKLLHSYDKFYTSIINFMEVYGYEFENQEEKILTDTLFDILTVTDLNKSIAEQVIAYRKRKSKKIKLPDAIILATAKYLNADLITDDWDDFIGIDPVVTIVKLDGFKIKEK